MRKPTESVQHLPLTADLMNEHLLLLHMLDLLKILRTTNDVQGLRDILALFRVALGELHHHKEEHVLFPALLTAAPLAQGGPRCGHFMNHPLNESFGEARDAPSRFAGTPLMIPIGEHRAGHRALALIERELLNPSGPHELYLLTTKFDTNLRLHIEKENTCLFVLADRYLPHSVQAELLANAASPEYAEKWQWLRSSVTTASRASGWR